MEPEICITTGVDKENGKVVEQKVGRKK